MGLLFLACLLVSSESTAAYDNLVHADGDTVVVSARAFGDAINPSAAGLVSVIDLEQETGSVDLAEVLGRTAGFQVRRYGGLGFSAVPSLRGSAAAQIRIFVDGLPLNDAQSGAVDLSRLPAERFSRAEIHRGVVPSGFGGMGGAGAVNLVTRRQTNGTEVNLFAGGFGSLGGRVSWGTANDTGSRSLMMMVHGAQADNDFEYLDHNQTFDNSEDDTTRTRQNAWFEEYGLWGRGHLETGPVNWDATVGWFRKDGGRPGPLNYPSLNASVRLDRSDALLGVSFPHQLKAELSASRQEEFLYDPANEIEDGFGGDIRSLGSDWTGRLSWSPELWLSSGTGSFFCQANLVAGVDHRQQWYQQWYGDQEDPQRNRSTDSAFASLPLFFFNYRLQLIPAWRYQRNEDDFPPLPALPGLPEPAGVQNIRHDNSPSVGLVWEVVPEKWFVESHAAHSVRIPTWVELFGHRGGIDGNRELQPEEITSADLALVWRPGSGTSVRLTAFWVETDQTIIFQQNSAATSQARNIGATRNQGLELEFSGDLPGRCRLQGNLTSQDARDRGEQEYYYDKKLPYLSDVEVDLRLSRPVGSWQPWLEVSFQSEKYRDRFNTEKIKAPERTLWNVGLSYLMASRMKISAEVINLTDDRTYDVVQFPLPGRTWQISLRLSR